VFFSVDYGHIYYYEPTDETIKPLARIHEDLRVLRGFYRLQAGPDGMVYGSSQSTNGLASIIRINPDTLEYQYVTGLGVPGRRTLTYGYYLAVEPPWVYVAVGQGQWELWSVDMDTGKKMLLAERVDPSQARVTVQQSAEGVCSAGLHGPPGPERLLLNNGQIVARAKGGEAFSVVVTPKKYAPLEWMKSTPVSGGAMPELNPTQTVTVDATGAAAVQWRPAGDHGDWRSVTFQINRVEWEGIETLTALPDGSLLGHVRQYHDWFRYYPATGKCDRFGKGGPSGARTTIVDGKVYFAGYPNTLTVATIFVD